MKDKEIIKIIAAKINSFEKGAMPLSQLPGELEGLQQSLIEVDAGCLKEFDETRFSLEEINAVILDEENDSLVDYSDFLASKLAKLKDLLRKF